MGVQVNESLTLENGIALNSYYIALAGEIVLKKILPLYDEDIVYKVHARFNVFATSETKTPIIEKHVHLSLPSAPTENIYELVYNKLKEELSNYTDDL